MEKSQNDASDRNEQILGTLICCIVKYFAIYDRIIYCYVWIISHDARNCTEEIL